MGLVPTRPELQSEGPAPRPPPRLDRQARVRVRRRIRATLDGLEADAVLLAGSIADAVATLGAGLWTVAIGTEPLPAAPAPEPLAERFGLTLHRAPAWHLSEGRAIAREELDARHGRRERTARLAAACGAARRQGADTVLCGAGAQRFLPERGLRPDEARRLADRYGLELVTPFADPEVRALADAIGQPGGSQRWRGRRWPAWALREAFAGPLSAALAWPMPSLGPTARQ